MNNSINDLFSSNEIADSDFNHLRLIFEDVLCTVSYIDVEETVFNEEIPKLKQACDEAIYRICSLLQSGKIDIIEEIKFLLHRFNTLINFANDAVKYINRRVEFIQVQSLPLPICKILFNAFKHCKESDNLYGSHFMSVSSLLTDLFKRARTLQCSFIHLMNNFIIFNLLEEHQNNLTIEVIATLSDIGEISSSLDIKSTAELWKGYLILSQTHIEHIKSSINIEKPLKHFCREITEALRLFEKLSDLKKVETNLKITSFNLKMIIKLCGLYDHLGNVYEDMFNLLITLNRYSIAYLQFQKYDVKIIDLMQVYVAAASEPLLSSLSLSREFVQYFFKNIKFQFNNDNNRLAASLLTISVLKKILFFDTDELMELWISNDVSYNIIFLIFDTVKLLHAEFSINLQILIPTYSGNRNKLYSLYEYLLIHTVSVIINIKEHHLKLIQQLLFESVIQLNIWKYNFAADVWCILARYGSEETCLQQLQFLINVFLMLQNQDKPEIYFLKNIMYRLFNLLTNKYKNNLIQAYSYDKYHKLWIIFDRNKENTNHFQLVYSNINSFLNCVNSNNFSKMIRSLELLPTVNKTNEVITQKITEKIKCIWMMLNANNFQQSFWNYQFIWTFYKVTIHLIEYINNKDLLNILQRLISLHSLHKKIQIINCMFLKTLSNKSIAPTSDQTDVFTTISQLFKIVLNDRNPIVKQMAFEAFSYFAQHTTHENILVYVVEGEMNLQEEISNYLQKIKRPSTSSIIEYYNNQNCVQFRHECISNEIETLEPVLKKKRYENSGQPNIEEILGRMKIDIDILNSYFKMKNIPETYVNDITQIADKLQGLLQK